MDTLYEGPWPVLLVLLPLSAYFLFLRTKQEVKKDESNIPWAPGAIPVLGHALQYKKGPSEFLVKTSQETGSMFQLNLAGKHMFVVCGPAEQKVVASAPESILSARQAVADIGFEQTLGHLNVHKGTDIHKGIIKGTWHKNPSEHVKEWTLSIEKALDKEVGIGTKKIEFFKLLRQTFLRATIERFISKQFLEYDNEGFLNEFMNFQDTLEDVTAKSVVLPRWIALPAMLWPLERRREKLQQKIANHLQTHILPNNNNKNNDSNMEDNQSADLGFWLQEMVHGDEKHTIPEIAEYIVGLLFAAHKNPAIGTAQAYLMLHEYGTDEDKDLCQKETLQFLKSPDWSTLQESCPRLRQVCLETLRLTAHSIGGVRTAKQDFEIPSNDTKSSLKYVIPKGASIGLAHIASSLDTRIWGPNAKRFDTTSTTISSTKNDKNNNTNKKEESLYDDEYKFTTFSHGVHKCPGQQIALVLLQCTMSILLHKYDIVVPSKKDIPSISFERATLAQRDGPVNVTMKRK